jgi:DNA primase
MPKEKKPFVDFRDIRSRITMEQVLSHYNLLDTFKRSGHTLSGPCPIHKGTNKTQFRVDTEKNLWNCFSECKHGGNTLDFITRMEDCSIHDAAIKACEWFAIPLDDVQGSDDTDDKAPALPRTANAVPSKLAELPKPDDGKPNPALKFRLDKLEHEHPYLTQERGLTRETIFDFGLGYFTGDRGMMVGHIVIPIHNVKGETVAYAGRWPGKLPDADTPKYKLPPGFKKSQELFNLDRASKEPAEQPLVIVEGFFDAIKLHQHGCRKVVAIMGATLSATQEALIREHTRPNGHIIVMLDENAAGQAGRDDIAARLSKHCFVRIHLFDQPNGEPEHLTPEQVQQIGL